MSSDESIIGAAESEITSNSPLSEDLALALLRQHDLHPDLLDRLSKNSGAKSHKVKLALAIHPRMPRHVALPLLRQLFTFELMQVALAPSASADIRVAAEESLMKRLETISSGQKLSLARRASGRVAAALLLDAELRVMQVALQNPHLTEASITGTLQSSGATATLVQAVSRDAKWSSRRDVQIALLHNENTSLACAVEFARALPLRMVRELIQASRLPEDRKSFLLREAEQRTTSADTSEESAPSSLFR